MLQEIEILTTFPLNLTCVKSYYSCSDTRDRVMGIRMLGVWGLPLGLLAAGPLIAWIGFPATVLLYCGLGLAVTFAIGYRWRSALWQPTARANAHIG